MVDSLTQESEPYATLRITAKATPQKPVKMAVTDANGKFQEKFAAVPGEYTLLLTSIGKTSVTKDFTLEAGKATVDLGTLYTAEATNELKGVEVLAQKPLVKVDVDKIEYNIEDDPDSKSNNILEMLRKVPLVTVDGEDNIQVNGSSSFKIHVNGKPNNMMSNNPKEVLKSMPANTIKYIEVITSPGAKYDAEGVGGILNIVTVGGGIEGYTATFSGRASNRGLGGGVYATIKKDKFTLSGNYNYSHNTSPENYSYAELENFISEDMRNLESNSTSKSSSNFQYGGLEASYDIDTLRLVSANFSLWGGGNDSDSWGSVAMYNAARSAKAYSYNLKSTNDGQWFSIRGGIDYQRMSSRNKARMWTLSYKIDTQPETSDYYSKYSDLVDVPDYLRLRNLHTEGETNTTEQTFQFDFTTPLGKIHTIEAGAKYILRNNISENDDYNAVPGTDQYVLDKEYTMHYKHLNNILATYFSYTLRYKKFTAKPGLRYEYTAQNVKYLLGNGENFKSDFSNLVPSISLGYKIGQMQNLTTGYSMRIYRPGIWNLNPYFDDRDPMNINQGNPNLEPEQGHNIDLGFSSFSAKFNVNLSLRHSFTNNSIERVTMLMQEDTELNGHFIPEGAVYNTYANIGKNRRTGMNLYVNWNASPKTRIYINGSGDYTDISSPSQNLHNFGWSGRMFAGLQHTILWNIRASLNGGGSTPRIALQGKGSGFYFYGLGLNKSFLKEDRLTFSINASNFFTKYNTYSNTTMGPNFSMKSEYKYPSRYFGASVSYRIGKLQASVKKAARSISNDDVKGNDGGGTGGGGAQGGGQ